MTFWKDFYFTHMYSRLNLVFEPSRTSNTNQFPAHTTTMYRNRSPTRVANYTCLALTYLSKASESHESMRDLSFFLSPSVVILKSWFDVVAFLHPQYTLYSSSSSYHKRKIHLEVRIPVSFFLPFVAELNNKPFYILLHWNSAWICNCSSASEIWMEQRRGDRKTGGKPNKLSTFVK